jgi:citrate lyase subunit beta-like protein
MYRSRRALLYVPGNDWHKMQKAVSLQLDCICLDLEDSIAFNQKESARKIAFQALSELDFGHIEKLVRVNDKTTGLLDADLAAILAAHPDGIVLPKVEDAASIQKISRRMAEHEITRGWQKNSLGILVIVETPLSIINLAAICQADERLRGIIFGAEDFAARIGATRTEDGVEVFHARSEIVIHCAAFGLQSIDMVNNNYHDLEKVKREADQGAGMGFTGKQVIHPSQVEIVQAAFTPSAEEVKRAEQIVTFYSEQQKMGKGAVGMEGRLIDLPIFRQAENVLSRSRQLKS